MLPFKIDLYRSPASVCAEKNRKHPQYLQYEEPVTSYMELSPSGKLSLLQPVKQFLALNATRRFITVFTTSRHLPLSWPKWIQFTVSNLIYFRSILIIFSHLNIGLPSHFFSSSFPTKILYKFLFFPTLPPPPMNLLFERKRLKDKETLRKGEAKKWVGSWTDGIIGGENAWIRTGRIGCDTCLR